MRILLAVLLLSLTPVLVAAPASAQNVAQGQASTAEVERYINAIRTLKARFVQSNPNGSVVQGTLYVRRPGRMRFEYDAPSQLKIVADGVNRLRSPERSMIVITHYQRLLEYIVPDVVHVLAKGKVVKSGGKDLALEFLMITRAKGISMAKQTIEHNTQGIDIAFRVVQSP